MSKIDMARKPYELPSPNMGDSLMMAMYRPNLVKRQSVKLNYSGWSNA